MKSAIDEVEANAEELLERLQLAELTTAKGEGLAAWRARLEKLACVLEALGRSYMSSAARCQEKIKAIDVLTASGTTTASAPTGSTRSGMTGMGIPKELPPDNPPDLRHTRVLAASFAGRAATGWNDLVHVAHREAVSRLGRLEALRGATKSNLIPGRASSEETKKGYRYVPEINLSIQNVDAAHAWSNALRLARYLKADVSVEFEWMQKSDAAFPGEKGILTWKSV